MSARFIGFFEIAKGILVLLGGVLFRFEGEHFLRFLAHYLHRPGIYLSPNIALGAAVLYALVRFAEGYGLIKNRSWAKWMGILSGAAYLPLELFEIATAPSILKLLITAANLLIVAYLWVSIKHHAAKDKVL